MRLSVTIFAVSENELRSSAGSNSRGLIDEIAVAHRNLLQKYSWRSDFLEKLKSPFRRYVLRHAATNIVCGNNSQMSKSGCYSLAYFLMCRKLSYYCFEGWPTTIRCTSPWLIKTVAAVERCDTAIDFHKLFFRGSVIKIPKVDTDGLGFGYWSATEVKRYRTDARRFLNSNEQKSTDDYLLAYNAVSSAYGWLSSASKRPDGAIVAFYLDCPNL